MQKPGYPNGKQSSCVIYVRISQDRTGEELTVERHEADCRRLASELGLEVEQVYSDNDRSATDGSLRPRFEAMLAARPKAIVAWHQDRLLRLSSDLERVIDLGCPVYMVHQGMLDLATPAGRAVARTVAAWTQYEGEQKRIRQQSKNLQLAEHGHWQFSLRPYGYKRVNGKIEQVPQEVAVLREGYERVLAGESYRSLAQDWNARRIAPLIGEKWMPARVQRLLENAHYGGVPSYRGKEVALAEGKTIQWTPVLSPREWRDFRELKLNRKRERSWAVSPKYLMSGMLVCGGCGGKMFSHAQDVLTRDLPAREMWRESWDAARREEWRARHRGDDPLPTKAPKFGDDGRRVKKMMYVCFDCHSLSIRAEYVDELVRDTVVGVLADERIVKALPKEDETTPLVEEIAELQVRRDNLTELFVEGVSDREQAKATLRELTLKIEHLQARLVALRAESPLSDIRLADSVPNRWDALSVLDRRRIISDLGLRLKVMPAAQVSEALRSIEEKKLNPKGKKPNAKETKPSAKEKAMARVMPVNDE